MVTRKSKTVLHSMTGRKTLILRFLKLKSKTAAETNKAVTKLSGSLGEGKTDAYPGQWYRERKHEELTATLGINTRSNLEKTAELT